ncbi:hypothetical protein ACSDR0_44830 [Streptosporangium sp. G11]|uniref:hypothetical protein n=1 Tax=Streptosporangium sp. G11 TaxID=3436926 RepID=UPI003EB9657B
MKIRYMLLHAYGMGGTIRTVLNQANAMADAGHDAAIASVVRRREVPHFFYRSGVKSPVTTSHHRVTNMAPLRFQ